MTGARRRVRVVAALVEHPDADGRYLCQQRHPGGPRGELWEFPGGKVEPGESEPEALAREGLEELGVTLEIGRRLWDGTHVYPDLEVELVLYAARIRAGVPQALDAQGLAWLTFTGMQALAFCEADVPLLAALVDGSVPTR